MKIIHSNHWKFKKKSRKDITNDLIAFAIQNSRIYRDKYWKDAFNAIHKIPQNGRHLKIVYKNIERGKVKIITAYWID